LIEGLSCKPLIKPLGTAGLISQPELWWIVLLRYVHLQACTFLAAKAWADIAPGSPAGTIDFTDMV